MGLAYDIPGTHAVRLPNCFRCQRPLSLSKWRAGTIQCPRCVRLEGRGTGTGTRCRVCDALLDPTRKRRNLLCPAHLQAYKQALWLQRKARRRAARQAADGA